MVLEVSSEHTMQRMLPLSAIVERLSVRRLSASGVARLTESIQRFGFLENFPLMVSPLGRDTYQLIEGNHRFEASQVVGLASVPCIVKTNLTEQEHYTLALRSNSAAETVVPSTLVTHAEFIWAREREGYTQQKIAEMMAWGRTQVANYIALKNIDEGAWKIIVTTFENALAPSQESAVTPIVTGVTFTENLLRDILPLTPEQQCELVGELASAQIKKGRFTELAKSYRARNDIYKAALQQLWDL